MSGGYDCDSGTERGCDSGGGCFTALTVASAFFGVDVIVLTVRDVERVVGSSESCAASKSRYSGWSVGVSVGVSASGSDGAVSEGVSESNCHSGWGDSSTFGRTSVWIGGSRLWRMPPACVHLLYWTRSSVRTLTGTLAWAFIQRIRASSSAESRSRGSASRQAATNSCSRGEYCPLSGRRGGWFLGISVMAWCRSC